MEKWQADLKRLREHLSTSNQQQRFQKFGENFERARQKGRRILVTGEGSLEDIGMVLAQDFLRPWALMPFSLDEADLSECGIPEREPKVSVPEDLEATVGGYAKYLRPGDILFILAHTGKHKRLKPLLKLAQKLEVKRFIIGGIEARSRLKNYSSIFLSLPTRGIKTICEAALPCGRLIARFARGETVAESPQRAASTREKKLDSKRSKRESGTRSGSRRQEPQSSEKSSRSDRTTWTNLKKVSAEITKQAQENVRQKSGQYTRPESRSESNKSNDSKRSKGSRSKSTRQEKVEQDAISGEHIAPGETNLLRAIEESSDVQTADSTKRDTKRSERAKKRKAKSRRQRKAQSESSEQNQDKGSRRTSARRKKSTRTAAEKPPRKTDEVLVENEPNEPSPTAAKTEDADKKSDRAKRSSSRRKRTSSRRTKKQDESPDTTATKKRAKSTKLKRRKQSSRNEVSKATTKPEAKSPAADSENATAKSESKSGSTRIKRKSKKAKDSRDKKRLAEAKNEVDALLRSSGLFGELELTSDEFLPRYIRDALDPALSPESGVFFGDESIEGPVVSKNFGLKQCKLQVSKQSNFKSPCPVRVLHNFEETGLSFIIHQDDELLENLGFRSELHCRLEIPAFLEPLKVSGKVVGLETHDDDSLCVSLKFTKLADIDERKVERVAAAISGSQTS